MMLDSESFEAKIALTEPFIEHKLLEYDELVAEQENIIYEFPKSNLDIIT